eukprot:scaffold3767_cov116-Skeletonema_menzelii.AAC.15
MSAAALRAAMVVALPAANAVLCEMNQFEFSCNDGEPRLIIGSIEVVTVDYLRKIQDGDCTFLNIVAIRRN